MLFFFGGCQAHQSASDQIEGQLQSVVQQVRLREDERVQLLWQLQRLEERNKQLEQLLRDTQISNNHLKNENEYWRKLMKTNWPSYGSTSLQSSLPQIDTPSKTTTAQICECHPPLSHVDVTQT